MKLEQEIVQRALEAEKLKAKEENGQAQKKY